ncbi:uncharacterized protein [Haliotis cracherodii]|uniref:uncharacterized protein n=1 Tax=Haliotis cracherodii TaxID=6455 RepID=UPI0039EC4709
MTAARARTGQVVGTVSSEVTITGHEKICIWATSLIFGSVPVAMIVLGILDYNLCPGDTRLGIYMVTQGATSVAIPILCSLWYCCQCVSETLLIVCCWVIGLFNIGWGITGTVWISESTCKNTDLYAHAFYCTIPMWILFGILALIVCVTMRTV